MESRIPCNLRTLHASRVSQLRVNYAEQVKETVERERIQFQMKVERKHKDYYRETADGALLDVGNAFSPYFDALPMELPLKLTRQ